MTLTITFDLHIKKKTLIAITFEPTVIGCFEDLRRFSDISAISRPGSSNYTEPKKKKKGILNLILNYAFFILI